MSLDEDAVRLLFDAARAQNEYAGRQAVYDRRRAIEDAGTGRPKGDRPGDYFNARASWSEWLTKWGWTHMGGRYWRRPGKNAPGISATVGFCKGEAGNDLLYVFSTNATPFEADTTYSLFAAYALIEFRGDYSAAAAELSEHGYGEPEIKFTSRIKADSVPDSVSVSTPIGVETETESGSQVTAELPDRLFLETSELKRLPVGDQWLWDGYLSRGGVTLLSAIWKVGKTTLLAHLMKALAAGGTFCGLAVKPCRVLFVSEESEHLWAERRDTIGLENNVGWMCRPFAGRPTPGEWLEFIGKVVGQVKSYGFDAVVFDTLAKLWPVRDENDAVQVDNALMPLWPLTDRAALMLVHHLRKGGGEEATGSRGSGALTAFVETIMELRRFAPGDRKDRRRVITGYGRYQETRDELVIELTDGGYTVVGEDRAQIVRRDVRAEVLGRLPRSKPGVSVEQITEAVGIAKKTLLPILWEIVEAGEAVFDGTGKRGDPYLFRQPVMDDSPSQDAAS